MVAGDLEITNGHAARMRFSRFKQHMEGVPPTPRKPRSSGGGRPKKPKAEKSKKEKPEAKVKKDKTEKQQQVKVDPALEGLQIKPDPEQMDVDPRKAEAAVKPEPVFKQETLDHAELGSPFGDYTYSTNGNQMNPLEQSTIQDPPSMFNMPDPILLENDWPAQSPSVKQEPSVKIEPGWYSWLGWAYLYFLALG